MLKLQQRQQQPNYFLYLAVACDAVYPVIDRDTNISLSKVNQLVYNIFKN